MSMPPVLAFLSRFSWPGRKVAVFCGAGWSAGTGSRAPRAAAGGVWAREREEKRAIAVSAASESRMRVNMRRPLARRNRQERNGGARKDLHGKIIGMGARRSDLRGAFFEEAEVGGAAEFGFGRLGEGG